MLLLSGNRLVDFLVELLCRVINLLLLIVVPFFHFFIELSLEISFLLLHCNTKILLHSRYRE